MNIANQFQEIGIFLTQDGLVTVLKKVAVSSMFFIVPKGVAGQKASHDRGDGSVSGS